MKNKVLYTFFICAVFVGLCVGYCRNKALENYGITNGIITSVFKPGGKTSGGAFFKYSVKGVSYNEKLFGLFYIHNKIGDTIIIKYAKSNPTVIKLATDEDIIKQVIYK